MTAEIGVRVVGGSEDEWVLVPAQPVSGVWNVYCIIDHDRHSDLELEFAPGNLVTTVERPNAEGQLWPVAYRLKGFPL
jgi:hypothetical protein